MMNNTNSHNSISYKSSSHNNGRRNTSTFGPDGCQVVIDGKRCGETKNLQIIKEFRKLYEDKMRIIDDIAGGDSIQAKVNLQQEWIKDLTDQNEMLVKVVEELEVEAAERVNILERKLEQSAKCACKKEDTVKERDRRIKELELQLQPYLDEDSKMQKDSQSLKENYVELQKSLLDMRDALTAEVADKHDTIICLRREVHLLEEQCKKAEQQTHFKDDIIKELRRELKQYKQLQLQAQSSPQKSKIRSPRKRIHQSKTDPDNTVNHHLKDGTIVIRDTETVGDTLATQSIREKFTDPANQTIVYICESIPQRQKANSKEASKNDSMLNDTRNCEVSMDIPNNRSNSFHMSMDHPRDLSNQVSLSSLQNTSLSTRPSIQDTCVQYSKDILEMLNQSYVDNRNITPIRGSASASVYSSMRSPDFSTVSFESKTESGIVEKLEKKVEKLIKNAEMKEKLHIDETIEMIYENGCLIKTISDQSRTHTSNAVQTCKELISEKDTQTSNTCFGNKDDNKKHCCKPSCVVCGNDDTTLVSLVSTSSKLNMKESYYFEDSKDVSFNKEEIRAYSSPYEPEHDMSGDVLEIKKIFRGNHGRPANSKARTVYYQETPKRHVMRRTLRPPIFVVNQRPKLLSPRTLHRRYNEEIAISPKSRSDPSCAPVKFTNMRHSYPAMMNGGYMVERRHFDGYAVDKDVVHGYVDCWPNRFENSY